MLKKMAPHRSGGTIDPGWEHGSAQDSNKKKVKCNYCGKVVSGGIFRFKQHLARISGQVTYCNHAPEDVCQKMKEALEGCQSIKKQRQSEEEQASLTWHSNDDYENEDRLVVSDNKKGKQIMGSDKNFGMNMTPLRSLGYVDPGWEHGIAQEEGKKKVKCNYCDKIVSGGINRFKQHLARIPGEVAPCKNAPEEVYIKMKENMKWHRTGRRNVRPEVKETSEFYMPSSDNEYEQEQEEDFPNIIGTTKLIGDRSLGTDARKRLRGRPHDSNVEVQLKKSRLDYLSLTMPKTHTPVTQPSTNLIRIKTGSYSKNSKEVTSAICKFFYHAGIPISAANSPYFHKMLDLVGQYGPGLKVPSSELISGQFLDDEIARVKQYAMELKASWMITGCTVIADSWKDAQGRTLIHFLVSCPRGTYFHSSVDSTEIVEDAANIFKLLDGVVEEVGEENVVQVLTENNATYRLAGKMLEEKRKNLFWTPCAANCIDQMLEDFEKIKWVGECMEKGQRVSKFIYNRAWLLNLMKKEFTGGMELLKPARTRIKSSFANLRSLLEHRTGIKRMFQSAKWLSSRFARLEEGKEVEKIVLNPTFWKKMQFVKRSAEPILQVLQKLDTGESLPISSLYNDMYRAKLTIRAIHGDDVQKYGPYWNVIERHWTSFYHPLYMAAYLLNPSYRYRHDFIAQPEVMRGLNDCIMRLETDNVRRIAASMQISDFGSAKSDFGTELAVSTRTEIDPAAWWQQHGFNCLELQRIAIRILSQTCSVYSFSHNYSIYDQIRSKSNNHITQKRLNDLMYVHYNLRLKENHMSTRTISKPLPFDSMVFENVLGDWILDTEKQAISQEDEEILHDEMEHEETDENEVQMDVHVVEPLEIQHPDNDIADNDEDEDLNLLDDLTD